jgi:hypothetical protein
MATTSGRSTPAHLWIVGILALLWYAYGCYEYLMTETGNPAFLSKQPAEWVAYWESLPAWLTAFWALGVWGGLLGAILLLVRSRHAVLAFTLSLIGAVVDLGYQLLMADMPPNLREGMLGVIDWVIIIVGTFLLWYSWSISKKGVLR